MIHTKYICIATLSFFALLNAQSFTDNKIDCADGNAQACYDAASNYSAHGYKVKRLDSKKAGNIVARFYKKSCDLGYAKGCTAYAMNYTSDIEKDTTKSEAYYFQKACDGGDETGCTMLEMMSMRTDILHEGTHEK